VSHKSPRTQKIGSNDPSYRYTLADIPVLLKTIDSLKQTIVDQQQTITTLQTENAQLKARLAELEARLNQNSTNSNRPPSSDGFRRPQTPRKKGGKPPGGQPGHPGRTLEQVADPDEITVHRVTTCSGCGASLASEDLRDIPKRGGARDFCRVRGYIATVKKHNQSILTALAGAVRGKPFVPTTVHVPG